MWCIHAQKPRMAGQGDGQREPVVSRGGPRRKVGAAVAIWTLLSLSACPQQPVPDAPPVAAAPAPVSRPTAPPSPPPPPTPGPQDIVVNQADLFGQFEGRQGAVVTIRALLVLTKNHPQAGHKGVISCAPSGGGSDDDWVPIGDVEVKKPLDENSRIQVRLMEANKPLLLPGSKKPQPLPKNARLRLRWEY